MAATQISISKGVLYPQPGYTVQVDKEGKWTATQIFLCHRDSAAALMPRPGTRHPELAFIQVVGGTIKYDEGDIAEITCQYAGAEATSPGADEKANATYAMGLSLSEEPILLHKRYADLGRVEKIMLQHIMAGDEKDDNGVKFETLIASDLGLEVLAKIQRGQTSYYSPRVTWKESWIRDKAATDEELNNIGKIDVPSGPVPALSGDRNWLHNGVTQTQDGKAFRLELEWMMSEREGWDPDIYTD